MHATQLQLQMYRIYCSMKPFWWDFEQFQYNLFHIIIIVPFVNLCVCVSLFVFDQVKYIPTLNFIRGVNNPLTNKD